MTSQNGGRVSARALLVVALVIVLVAVSVRVAWSRGSLNGLICGGECGPEAVAAPVGLGSARAGDASVREVSADGPGAAAVRRAVDSALRNTDALGPRVGVAVSRVSVGEPSDVLVEEGPAALVPASTTKLLTAYAALSAIDPQQRFATTVVRDGSRLTLVGGGDPYLVRKRGKGAPRVERAELSVLAARTATALRRAGVEKVSLRHDTSLFSGPEASTAWEKDYVPAGIVTRIGALWIDEGRLSGGGRSDDPAQDAADAFAAELASRGIDVADGSEEAQAPSGAREVARVESATLAQVVESLLVTSDNEASEVVLRHVGLAESEPGSFAGGATAIEKVLADAGVGVKGLVLTDGSGLSRKNRIAPSTLARVVALAPTRARTSSLVTDIPVGGFSGTLKNRFSDAGAARGSVRAKTGTLTGVHAIAGMVTTRSGAPLAFSVMTDATKDINPFVTQAALDDLAVALANLP
ncbi:hypothetical protein ASD11_13475 [Aeromicrobium sp. Root495]|uniref:D-alanyl-D-alanine carboxypeptidase/D-alanyl-D-alanine endopeptidase n=1 Tax=Aeromicrobium sp. Root495 TaxID=1736550 RepID=UPI0006F22B84|nr:D-alanyl-D-alanine carboxypeptidase/D-alanyl-D-alanine-endopeptidase [Aeromicrobium sp. Root495]KQY60452.1 hypothetical protein ASD11_13475 [Aeromicrobium sp. Root495]